jgi:excisionase family DNA binding protein
MPTTNGQSSRLPTLSQAADFLQRSRYTLYAMVEQGLIPHVKVGRALMFFEDELVTLLREQREIAPAKSKRPRASRKAKARTTAR